MDIDRRFCVRRWLLLPTYFAVSGFTRVFSIILFLTPSLGLFDTLRLAQTGLYPASNQTAWDVLDNGTVVTLHDEWQRLRLDSMSDLFMQFENVRVRTWREGLISS